MGTRKPRPVPVSTTKAMAACSAHGLTYHAHADEGETLFWGVGADGAYHVVKKQTSRGITRSAHYCRTYRTMLAQRLSGIWPTSRDYVHIELILVSPAWLCDNDSELIEVGAPADALAQIWVEGRPE